MSAFRELVALGDSVVWGQGLLEKDKYSSKVADALQVPPNRRSVLAHSGAIIGIEETNTAPICHGEVPTGLPTLLRMLETVNSFPPETLVLISGGINDVELARILNPLTTSSKLRRKVRKYCGAHMGTLIQAVLRKVVDKKTRIVVTGYFPILSRDSTDGSQIELLLSLHGVSLGAPVNIDISDRSAIVKNVVDQCLLFWEESSVTLKETVAHSGSAQVLFVNSGFGPKNSLFASEPWLWSPLESDPLESTRKTECPRCEHNPFKLPICLKASTGHPNALGAEAYAKAICSALGA